jgi:hypothetical protein
MAEAVQGTDRPSSLACVLLASAIHVQDVIARALRLSGGANDELAVRAEIARPRGEVGGGVVEGAVLDAGDAA